MNTAEVILLNDSRWGRDALPWEQILLLLEGDIVNILAPKNQFGADIEFFVDTPIEFKSGNVDTAQVEQENAMMRSRWKVFHFTYEFSNK